MSTLERKTILLVEDESMIAMAEAQTIEGFGYAVRTARSGEAAVEIASGDSRPDLILMDIDLGKGMSGPEAAAQILRISDIPIVFLTSHAEREMAVGTPALMETSPTWCVMARRFSLMT